MSKLQCQVNDALSIDNKPRWVDCKLVSGDIVRLTNSNTDTYGVRLEYKRVYLIDGELVWKTTQEIFYYKIQIRIKECVNDDK